MNDPEWIRGTDRDGVPCEYHTLTGRVRYPLDDDDEAITQEELDALMMELSDNPLSPMPTMLGQKCSDCNGKGSYQGLFIVEKCKTCNGAGEV